MRQSLSSKLAGSAVALLLTLVPAQGQQQDITAQEVESYFRQVQQDAVEIMRSRDSGRLLEWVDANIVDGTVVQASITIHSNGIRKGFADLILTKDDMRRMTALYGAVIAQRAIGDYSLEVTVTDVVPHGPGAATATARWTERISINAGQAEAGESQPGQQPQTVTIEAVAECTHLLRRSEGALAFGLMTCNGDVRL